MEKDDKKKTVSKKKDSEYSNKIDINPRLDENVEDVEEALDRQQRRAKSIAMRRNRNKLSRGRAKSAKRAPTMDRLKTRARKKAIDAVRKKLAPTKKYSELGSEQKAQIDAKVGKKKALVDKMAKRLLPSIRRAAMDKKKSVKEESSIDETTAPTKRYHESRTKNGDMKYDGRFRAFKKKKEIQEDSMRTNEKAEYENDEDLMNIIESVADIILTEDSDLDTLFEEHFNEGVSVDKIVKAVKSQIDKGTDFMDAVWAVSRAKGVDMGTQKIRSAYIEVHGDPKEKKMDPAKAKKLKMKYGFKHKFHESYGFEYEETLDEEADKCKLIGQKQIKEFEKLVDRLFEKFDIDFNFTKHFGERMSHERNNPCITLKELAAFMKKIYARQGKSLKGIKGAEGVIKDLQTDLNIPVAVKYDSRNDEFDVVLKTIMRKKNFRVGRGDKEIKY